MTHKLIHTPDYLLVVDDSGTRIAHLPLNNSPILEGVDLLPPFSRHQEDGIEEYSKECNQLYKDWLVTGYKAGYNKAKERCKYTEEDMWEIFVRGMGAVKHEELGTISAKQVFDNYLQSLSQPKMPIGFERETVCDQCLDDDSVDSCYCNYGSYKIVPKKTTNSQGQTVWVGKYIY